ncbi:DUF1566 domain-containing protein [Leptospira sp. 201903070]|uniref:DUF1566 domain-containing protein n=1 Tax=Leptospira ainlahdjerensis TaxID=2810033 RepID=A0ABS2UH47_9LEPT|nr:DUF1566 domain-containing protein [Leptospira ainlahdjerensis]MBM9579715.1 DUF1566 domain-containing protein [Leptospira ainlahdjerensis]
MRAKVFLLSIFLSTPFLLIAYTGPFTDVGNGTILDQKSGLVWQKCASGQGSIGDSYSDCTIGAAVSLDWISALAYCNSLNLGGGAGWRLPSVKELVSLVDYSKATSPFINQVFFPNASSNYWASTTHPSGSYKFQAYQVLFANGTYDTFDKTTALARVRCVR